MKFKKLLIIPLLIVCCGFIVACTQKYGTEVFALYKATTKGHSTQSIEFLQENTHIHAADDVFIITTTEDEQILGLVEFCDSKTTVFGFFILNGNEMLIFSGILSGNNLSLDYTLNAFVLFNIRQGVAEYLR